MATTVTRTMTRTASFQPLWTPPEAYVATPPTRLPSAPETSSTPSVQGDAVQRQGWRKTRGKTRGKPWNMVISWGNMWETMVIVTIHTWI